MDSKFAEMLPGQRPVPVYLAPQRDRDDTLGLADLWSVVARHKGVALLTVFVSIALAVTYLYFAEPVYRATARLLPPQQRSVQALLIDTAELKGIGVERVTPEAVYARFFENLTSQGLRREFFDSNKLVSHYTSDESGEDINVDRIFDTRFDKNLRVQTDEQTPSLVTVSFSDTNPEMAAKLLNQIIEFSNKRTSQQLVDDVNSAIQTEMGQIRRKLDSKLELAKERRHDKIINLKEALRVAKTLGIKENGIIPKNLQQSQTGLAVNTAQTPLYMRGTEALETEIDVLESRKSDEPFIAGFRDLQERRAFLGSISIDPDSLSAVTLDETARVPYRKEKPKVVLVILLASMLGIFVAVFAAFIAESLSRPR